MTYDMILLFLLVLLPASLTDIYCYRVPNAIPCAGIVSYILLHLMTGTDIDIVASLSGMMIPLIIFFIFFKFHMFGASDGKLMAVVGVYTGYPAIVRVMIMSLFSAGVISVAALIIRGNTKKRFTHLISYVNLVKTSGRLSAYYDIKKEKDDGVIPFSVAITIATLLHMAYTRF